MKRLAMLEEVLGEVAADELACAVEDVIRVAAGGGKASVLFTLKAKSSEKRPEKVITSSVAVVKQPLPKPDAHLGEVFVVEGRITVEDPQPSMFARDER